MVEKTINADLAMHIMPREAPGRGGTARIYTPETCRNWRVEMEVWGFLWWPTWTGPARDSQHAKDRARRDFVSRWGAQLPLRVRVVVEVS